MKIKTTSIQKLLIILCILSQSSFFHLVDSTGMLALTTLLILVTFSISIIYKIQNPYIDKYILEVICLVFLLQGFYTVLFKNQDIISYITAISPMLAILLVRPLYIAFIKNHNFYDLLDIISFLMNIYMCIIILNAFLININGNVLVNTDYFLQDFGMRSDRLRIMIDSPFQLIMPIYSFSMIIDRAKCKKLHYFTFLIHTFALFYVTQTRILIVTFVITISIMISMKIPQKKYKYILYVFVFFTIVIGLSKGVFDSFFSSFSINNYENGSSTRTRLIELEIAIKNWLKNPILGTGITLDYKMPMSQYGYRFIYNYTDLGLIGSISYMGISFIVLFIMPVVRHLRFITHVTKKYRQNKEFIIYIGLLTYICVSSFTILITDNFRIFGWPFVLAILEYLKWNFRYSITYEQKD